MNRQRQLANVALSDREEKLAVTLDSIGDAVIASDAEARVTPVSYTHLFRVMSDASPLGIFVADTAGACIYTNAAYHRISGLSFEQALVTRCV